MTERIIIAGSGGQGVMTLGKLLAQAAMDRNRQVTYLPSYGAEVRGGTANCAVVISDEAVYSPVIERMTVFVVLNQPSYDRFRARLEPNGLLVLNTSSTQMTEALEKASPARVLRVPAGEEAVALGNIRVANIVILGAYAAACGGIDVEDVLAVLREEFTGKRAHLLEVNRQAFLRGHAIAAEQGFRTAQ